MRIVKQFEPPGTISVQIHMDVFLWRKLEESLLAKGQSWNEWIDGQARAWIQDMTLDEEDNRGIDNRGFQELFEREGTMLRKEKEEDRCPRCKQIIPAQSIDVFYSDGVYHKPCWDEMMSERLWGER